MTTYTEYEESVAQGEPIELYDFEDAFGSHWRMNTGNKNISYGGFTYGPGVVDRGEIVVGGDFSDNTVDIMMARGNAFTKQYMRRVIDSIVSATIIRCHVDQFAQTWSGYLRNIKRDENGAPTCVFASLLTGAIGVGTRRRCQRPCDHVIYDNGCGLNIDTYAVPAVVEAVSDEQVTIQSTTFSSKASGWFKAGLLKFGDVYRFIISHSNDTIVIDRRFYTDLSVGDSVTAYAGCDLLPETCRTKFSNIYNFGGLEFLATEEYSLTGIA